MKEEHIESARSEGLGSAENSSFKQLIRDVENLVPGFIIKVNEEDHRVSTFDIESPKPELSHCMTNG